MPVLIPIMLLIATFLLFKTLLWFLYLDSISVIHPDILKLESTFQLELFSSLFIGAFLVICVFWQISSLFKVLVKKAKSSIFQRL